MVAVDESGNAVIWFDDADAEPERFAICPGRAHQVVLSQSGFWLACATRDRLTIRDVVGGGERTVRFDEDFVARALALDEFGTWAAVGEASGRVRLVPLPSSTP